MLRAMPLQTAHQSPNAARLLGRGGENRMGARGWKFSELSLRITPSAVLILPSNKNAYTAKHEPKKHTS